MLGSYLQLASPAKWYGCKYTSLHVFHVIEVAKLSYDFVLRRAPYAIFNFNFYSRQKMQRKRQDK